MSKPDEYRAEAAKALAQSNSATDPEMKTKYSELEDAWMALARAAEVHAQLDAVVVDRGGRSNPVDFD